MTSNYEQQKHEQVFGRGTEKGKHGGFVDDAFHELGKIFDTVIPGVTTEHQSEERGYEEGQRQRTGW